MGLLLPNAALITGGTPIERDVIDDFKAQRFSYLVNVVPDRGFDAPPRRSYRPTSQ